MTHKLNANRFAKMLCVALGLALFAGCSVNGKWSLTHVDPTAARRDFEYQSLTLQKDGTFYGEAKEGMGTEAVSGTYTYENGVLALKAHDGERQTYDAELVQGGRTLKLSRHWEDRKLMATFDRTE